MKHSSEKIFSKKFLKELFSYNNIEINNITSPLVSVVMPSFNQDNFIEKSILSVLNQNYNNIELIIIDGGSTDKSISIIKKYEEHIRYWISEKDNGQSDALNKGFKIAKGDILCWLNSDDLLLPDSISIAVETLSKNLDKKICYGDWISIDENDDIKDKHFAFDFNTKHFVYEGFHLNSQSLFWRKEVHDNFTGFDTSLNLTMDYQMILEFAINNSDNDFIRVNKFFAAFRRYEGQKTASYDENVHLEHLRIASKYNFEDKFLLTGRVKRLFFRFRRALWYFKRGGFKELIKRFFRLNAYN